jgi:hypothetical protein
MNPTIRQPAHVRIAVGVATSLTGYAAGAAADLPPDLECVGSHAARSEPTSGVAVPTSR